MATSKEVTLRRLTVADLKAVAEIERKVFGSGGYQLLAIRQLFDLFPSLVWVAADTGGKVVGHVFGAVAEGGETGWILNFGVLAHYRRTGTGTRLLETLIEQLIAAGVLRIQTTAEVDNDDAKRIYGRLGFAPTEIVTDYYGDGTDRQMYVRTV